jgi:hypothetical protein
MSGNTKFLIPSSDIVDKSNKIISSVEKNHAEKMNITPDPTEVMAHFQASLQKNRRLGELLAQ